MLLLWVVRASSAQCHVEWRTSSFQEKELSLPKHQGPPAHSHCSLGPSSRYSLSDRPNRLSSLWQAFPPDSEKRGLPVSLHKLYQFILCCCGNRMIRSGSLASEWSF